jgi:hypothetical protein
MRCDRLSLVILVLLALVRPAAGQAPPSQAGSAPEDDPQEAVTNSGPIIPFLEGTDVFFALRRDTVFEADIMPHLVVFQNFSDVIDITEQSRRAVGAGALGVKRFALAVSGTPAVRLRMFEEISRPVRTPSYMPRGNIQVIWARNVDAVAASVAGNAAPRPAAPAAQQISLWEGHGIVGHHSNGQDGCLFQDEERVGEDCQSVLPIEGERLVNKRDGSFSTNYVRLGINYRRNLLADDLWTLKEWGFKAEVEYHPRAWIDDDIEDIYGRTRFNLGGTYAMRELPWCPRRAETSAELQIIKGHPDPVWPIAIAVQGSCFPTRQGGWGFFVRYYGGQDYYNLGFLENIQRVHVGATFNQSGFFRFRHTP